MEARAHAWCTVQMVCFAGGKTHKVSERVFDGDVSLDEHAALTKLGYKSAYGRDGRTRYTLHI